MSGKHVDNTRPQNALVPRVKNTRHLDTQSESVRKYHICYKYIPNKISIAANKIQNISLEPGVPGISSYTTNWVIKLINLLIGAAMIFID